MHWKQLIALKPTERVLMLIPERLTFEFSKSSLV